MNRILVVLLAIMLGLGILLPDARVDAATPTPSITRGITCKACDEDEVKPVVNFWLRSWVQNGN